MAEQEQEWPIGRTITRVREITEVEMRANGWDWGSTAVIELDDGGLLYASQDDEGNGPGTTFGVMPNGDMVYVFPHLVEVTD